MRRWLASSLAALIVPLGVLSMPDEAEATRYAQPKSPGCVTEGEWDALHLRPLVSLAELQRQWGVKPSQRVDDTAGTANIGSRRGYWFPVCGHSMNEVVIGVLTERTDRPGYVPKPANQRVVASAVWWDCTHGLVGQRGCFTLYRAGA